MWALLQSGPFNPNTDMLKWSLGELGAAFGGPEVFAFLAGGVLLLSFYIASNGGLAAPATLTALVGGVLIASLPAGYQSMGQVIIFLGLVAALLAGFRKYGTTNP
jgi:hypothetical protein